MTPLGVQEWDFKEGRYMAVTKNRAYIVNVEISLQAVEPNLLGGPPQVNFNYEYKANRVTQTNLAGTLEDLIKEAKDVAAAAIVTREGKGE